MKYKLSSFIAAALLAAALFTPCSTFVAHAQTTGSWYDRPVTIANGAQINKSIARPARENYSIVVWEDYRSGNPEIYIQAIDRESGLALWQPLDGIKVADGDMQYYPKAVYDSLDGVYIVWEDHINGASFPEIKAQRIEVSSGTIDPNWPTGGLTVSANDYIPSDDHSIVGTQRGFYCVYTDHNANTEVILTHVFFNMWIPGNFPVYVDPSGANQTDPVVTTDGVYDTNMWMLFGAYIAYETDEQGFPEIKGVHYSLSTGLGNAEFLDDQTGASCYNPIISPTGPIPGDTRGSFPPYGAVIIWEESSSDNGYDIMGQNLDEFGGGGRGTGVQYSPATIICDEPYAQTAPAADCYYNELGVYCYVVWEDMRDYVTYDKDIYVSYFDVYDGTILASPISGVEVCVKQSYQSNPAIEVFTPGPIVVCWQGMESSLSQVFEQEFSYDLSTTNGPVNGWLVANVQGGQSLPEIGKGFITFQDYRRGQHDIYTQYPASLAGVLGVYDSINAIWKGGHANVVSSVILGTDAAMDADGNSYVTWYSGDMNDSTMVYVQKMSPRGTALWGSNGIALGKFGILNLSPTICAGTTGSAYVTWYTFDDAGNDSVYCSYISCDGDVYGPYCLGSGTMPDIDRDDYLSNKAFIAYTDDNYLVNVVLADSAGSTTAQSIGTLYSYLYGPKIVRQQAASGFYIASIHDPNTYEISYSRPSNTPISSGIYGDMDFDIAGDESGQYAYILGLNVSNEAAVYDILNNSLVTIGDPGTNNVAGGFAISAKYDDAYALWYEFDGAYYSLHTNTASVAYTATSTPVLKTSYQIFHSDIVYATNTVYAVWEHDTTSGTVIVAQAMDYTLPGSPQVWSSYREVMPDDATSVLQQFPVIVSNNAGWNPPAVFFIEDINTTAISAELISCVRIFDEVDVLGNHEMFWYKNSEPATFELGVPYPSPYALSSGAELVVPIALGSDAVSSVRVYNMLGQEVLQSSNTANGMITFTPSQLKNTLLPGMYIVTAHSALGVTSKSILVTK